MYKIHTYYSVIFVHTIVHFIWGTICCTQCNIFLWLEVYILWPCNHLNKIANVFLATERKRWWQIIKSFSQTLLSKNLVKSFLGDNSNFCDIYSVGIFRCFPSMSIQLNFDLYIGEEQFYRKSVQYITINSRWLKEFLPSSLRLNLFVKCICLQLVVFLSNIFDRCCTAAETHE